MLFREFEKNSLLLLLLTGLKANGRGSGGLFSDDEYGFGAKIAGGVIAAADVGPRSSFISASTSANCVR